MVCNSLFTHIEQSESADSEAAEEDAFDDEDEHEHGVDSDICF